MHDPGDAPAAWQGLLLSWYAGARRDLPWRRTRDPYAVWISETMLQQTRVETVIPYYERFLRALPTVASLAEAPEEQVLALWSGLGYYRRARMLHAAARRVAQSHGGRIPSDPEALRGLEGVGAYTAGAVASIAFGKRAARRRRQRGAGSGARSSRSRTTSRAVAGVRASGGLPRGSCPSAAATVTPATGTRR